MPNNREELMLLERVFLRLGSAETDEQLENIVMKFLAPVLLKLSSPHEEVRKKVMELLTHVSKRIKTRPDIQLPVETLLNLYSDPASTSFIINFTIIYIKIGFPRLPIDKQIELVPLIIKSLNNKPPLQIVSLLLIITPLLDKVKIPSDCKDVSSVFGFDASNSAISKCLLELLLDMLLLPYSSVTPQADQQPSVALPTPSCMSEESYKRIKTNISVSAEELEQIKLGIIKFLSTGVFSNNDILIHLIVAAADTRFAVANLGDTELKKVLSSVDWSSPKTSTTLFSLFLGSSFDSKGTQITKQEQKKKPANTRIRLKLLTYLCKITGSAFLFPQSIQVVFDSLYGENTNVRLKTLVLSFVGNLIRYVPYNSLNKVAPVLLAGLIKLINEAEEVLKGPSYVLIGMLGQKYPHTVFHDISLLELYYKNLEKANADLKIEVREGFLSLISAYKYNNIENESDKDGRLDKLYDFVKSKIDADEPAVRFISVRTLATVFPSDHVPSKFLLLLATGDSKDEIAQEAQKSIYGIAIHKNAVNTLKNVVTGILPPFSEIVAYVHKEAQTRTEQLKEKLPFSEKIFVEILIYLRLCLLRDLNLPLTRNVLRHPCEHTPKVVKHIQALNDKYNQEKNPLIQYSVLIKNLLKTHLAAEPILCLIELVGSLSTTCDTSLSDFDWLNAMSKMKEEVSDYWSTLHALVVLQSSNDGEFRKTVQGLIDGIENAAIQVQRGLILTVGTCLENYVLKKKWNKQKFDQDNLLQSAVVLIATFLKNPNSSLVSAACVSIGSIGRVISLPLEDGNPPVNDSPNAKRPAKSWITKMDLVERLLDVMNNAKLTAKVREKAARTLGLICVGEKFIHTKEILQGLINTARETKDVEIHFTIGESLVMCCQSVWSPEARDAWRTDPKDYSPSVTEPMPDENLNWLLGELLLLADHTHPNSKQASAIWLLAVIKACGERDAIKNHLQKIQNTFMALLGENNDIIQDVASKGLCVVYDAYKSEDLLTSLVKQLTSGSQNVMHVTDDTKLFEKEQLGKSPTGGNLTTYKELCSLASDLNKPDLIYQFMHLANHNAIWNSKKGAAFGFSSIAEKCGEDLKNYLPQIIPKLYRYQYDPTPSIQISMSNIWKVLVPEPQKTLDQFYNEILTDLLANLNSSQFRVRQSCCLAFQDFLKGSPNRSIHDAVNHIDEIWSKLFRVMDDHHEATRLTANRTAKILSKLCIRGCDISQGKNGIKMVEAVLPPLLNTGITHTVAEIRLISLQTVSELVTSAGKQLKPFLSKLIPALLQATGELESTKLSYLSTMLSGQSQHQETVDSARASIAKSHFTTETVSKSLQYADASILEELVPRILELLKGSVPLGTRIATAHFVTMLTLQLGKDIQPYSGKILASLVNGLTDRNSAIRRHYATSIGHLVTTAKDSSLEKLFKKLEVWYFEREDDSIRSACAQTIQSIAIRNQEIIKNYADHILPLVFFAMHAEKSLETQNTLDIWNEIWTEQSHGTEAGIKQNIEQICELIKKSLESASWTAKAQAANAASTVANKLGTSLESKYRNFLLKILLNGLTGRTWNGKDKLLKALSSICTHCSESIKNDKEINAEEIIEALLRESRKEEISYKIASLQCLGEVVSSLEIDKFDEVYNIIKPILSGKDKNSNGNPDGIIEDNVMEDAKKERENETKLKEIAYETLGRAWPLNGETTQKKYRELFVDHSVETLPKVNRFVQISIMSALYCFVNKLILAKQNEMNEDDKNSLRIIIEKVLKAITYSLGISRNTRLRKEALNTLFCLATKLEESRDELNKLITVFNSMLPELSEDSQPEIKSRLFDIKKLFSEK